MVVTTGASNSPASYTLTYLASFVFEIHDLQKERSAKRNIFIILTITQFAFCGWLGGTLVWRFCLFYIHAKAPFQVKEINLSSSFQSSQGTRGIIPCELGGSELTRWSPPSRWWQASALRQQPPFDNPQCWELWRCLSAQPHSNSLEPCEIVLIAKTRTHEEIVNQFKTPKAQS